MATTHKLSADLYQETYDLIALHSSLPSYTMAFQLNKYLGSNFTRTDNDLYLDNATFARFEWYDEYRDAEYCLFSNKGSFVAKPAVITTELFSEESFLSSPYLVQEHSKVDYFLKIKNEQTVSVLTLIKAIQTIPHLSMTYVVDSNTLKSKDNLISLSDAN